MSGDLATVRIHIEVHRDPRSDLNPRTGRASPRYRELAGMLVERRREVATYLRQQLREGDRDLRVDVSIIEGSIEILAIVSAVGLAIKSYAEFVENLDKAAALTRRHVIDMLDAFGAEPSIAVTASWEPGPALERLAESAPAAVAVAGPLAYPLLRLLLPYAALACLTVIALVVAFRATR